MSKIKIEIKNRFTGVILFEYDKENNTIKETVEEAVKQKADLRNAYLSNADLRNAYLSNADLRNADLRNADLRNADLRNADLRYADLRYANLSNADLRYANLYNADLRYADLSNANLYNAYLSNADLRNADLRNADLRYANLSNANLSNAKLDKDKFPLHKCNILPEGDLIGWKKVHGKIVKLLIPSNAKRVHAISHRKCRAEFAKVLWIEGDLGEITNKAYHDAITTYKVGEIVRPNDFNDCWLTECGKGINFFINKQEAIEY